MPTFTGKTGAPALVEMLREMANDWDAERLVILRANAVGDWERAKVYQRCIDQLSMLLDGFEAGGGTQVECGHVTN